MNEKSRAYSFSSKEYEKIVSLLGREPTSIEQALFSALWSEHCSYKSSKVHLKKFAQSSPRVITGFGENAGVIDLGYGEKAAFKMESHNHPSRIEPFHGAMTGVGGILRDIFAMNARPVCLANYLCFGDIHYPITKRLLDGVVRGIGGYGNCIGLPTITGQTEFHSSFNENILVNALALGVYGPSDEVMTSRLKKAGSYVVYAGAMTGRDGIHGARMASESFSEKEKLQSTVQVGDPFYGKLLMEACLEVMGENLAEAVQDMGAAGIISSSFEMAAKGSLGMELHLDRVPLRDSTMTAEEILLSESQERMLLVCRPDNYPRLERVFKKWGLKVSVLGEVIEERKMKLFWEKKLLTSIDPFLLTHSAPEYNRAFHPWSFPLKTDSPEKTAPQFKKDEKHFLKIIENFKAHSREFIFNQYDQRVGSSTAGDCSFPIGIVQLPYTKRFLGLALGGRPYVLNTDSFEGGKDAVFYPAVQLAVRGFEPLAATDCLNFGNPEKEEIMSQFSAVVDGMAKACKALNTPIVSGNVSFYNESSGKNIIPASSTGLVGLKNENPWPKNHFQSTGENIYLVHTHQCYLNGLSAEVFNESPLFYGEIDCDQMNIWIHKLLSLSCEKEVLSARAVGKFGLAYAVFRMTLNGWGAEIECGELDPFQERLYEVIFTVSSKNQKNFEQKLKTLALNYKQIGRTIPKKLSFSNYFSLNIDKVKKSYQSSFI